MNKLYFASNAINIYAEDLQYMQDSLAEEAKKILIAITGATADPVISAGFYAYSDGLYINIDHSTSSTSTGAILTGDGILATTTEAYSGIALSDYTLNTKNYIYAKYYSQDATYDIKTGTIIYEAKAIDLNTYTYTYNRQIDLIEIVILTAIEYAELTATEQKNYVLLGTVIAQGVGVNLPAVSYLEVKYLAAAIPDGSIVLAKLVPSFMLPQTMVDPTEIVDDNYPVLGTTSDLQDDLNQIRTVIRHIKSTTSWNEDSVGIKASDPDINHLFRSGLFIDWLNNDNIAYGGEVLAGDSITPTSFGCTIVSSTGMAGECITTPYTSTGQGVIVSPGKILYKDTLVELYSSTGGIGLIVTPPNLYPTGVQYHTTHPASTPAEDLLYDYGYGTLPYPSSITIPAGTIFQVRTSTGDAVYPISEVTIKYVDNAFPLPHNYITATENIHYTVNYALGQITVIDNPIVTSEKQLRIFYTWGKKRIDTVVYDTSSTSTGGLRIIDGIPEFSYNVVYPPEIPTYCFAIANLQWELAATQLYNKDVVSHYFNMKSHRNVSEITATQINQYDTDGDFRDTFIEAVGKLNVVLTSTGAPQAIGSGYTITSTGTYPYMEINASRSIHTNIFTQADDELYISVFQQTADYTLTIEVESVSGTGVFDTTLIVTVPKNSDTVGAQTVPVLLFVAKGSTEGYHKLRIRGSVTYKFHKLVFGKLDDYYLKNNFYTEYITTKKVEATNITVTNQITSSVAVGTMPLVVSSTTNCSNLSVDYVDNRHHSDITPIGTIAAFLPGLFNSGGLTGYSAIAALALATQTDCWKVCDGSIVNDANSLFNGRYLPKLDGDRFLMGGTSIGTAGGNANNLFTISETYLPSHKHGPGTLYTATESQGHTHSIPDEGTYYADGVIAYKGKGADYTNYARNTGGESASHYHTVSYGETGATGGGTAMDVRPLYLTAYYIMRIK
jgi:hypothetical protein